MARGFVPQDLWTMEQLPFAGSPLPAFESDTSLATTAEWVVLFGGDSSDFYAWVSNSNRGNAISTKEFHV